MKKIEEYSDAELTVLSAASIDRVVVYDLGSGLHWLDDKFSGMWWDPLSRKADAFDLIVGLGIKLKFNGNSVLASLEQSPSVYISIQVNIKDDKEKAAMAAVTQVAAAFALYVIGVTLS
jgi:hypothetical protein